MTLDKNEANRSLIEKVNELETQHNEEFSNTQKILLTTDGSITAILDVLFGKITLTTLDQQEGKPLIYAISHIPLKRCTKDVCTDLLSADIPIGRILKNYHIESRREINNIFIEKPNDTLKEIFKTDEDMLARDYVIINNDQILMWIKEVFPKSYFR